MVPNQQINSDYNMPPQKGGNTGLIIGLAIGITILIAAILVAFFVAALLASRSIDNKGVGDNGNSYQYPAKIQTEPNGLVKISTKKGSIDLYINQSLLGDGWENNVNSEEEGDYEYYNAKYDCSIAFFIVSDEAYYSPESYNQANIDSVINTDMKYNDISSTIDSQKNIDDLKVKKFNSNPPEDYSLRRRQYSGIYNDGVNYTLRTAAITNRNEAISVVDECANRAPQEARSEVDSFLSELRIQLN